MKKRSVRIFLFQEAIGVRTLRGKEKETTIGTSIRTRSATLPSTAS
ncbi:hypothetical protein [Paenibacillus sp. Marseille-Q4541]|nr:hypothetical protein [Paenibacillus sp. Marseille-Q4541]